MRRKRPNSGNSKSANSKQSSVGNTSSVETPEKDATVPVSAEELAKQALKELEDLELDVFQVKLLTLENGSCPYDEWYRSIKDTLTRVRIRARVDRLELGMFGDNRSVGGGVFELRLDFGPGYRVYYARWGNTIIVLVGGGDKSDQSADIEKAKSRWEMYKNAPERLQ